MERNGEGLSFFSFFFIKFLWWKLMKLRIKMKNKGEKKKKKWWKQFGMDDLLLDTIDLHDQIIYFLTNNQTVKIKQIIEVL